jgi:50S ribosomal protein L16 3-hydroxylase
LGELSPQQFLNRYWQKEPVVIRQAFRNFPCPVTPEELGGLALEAEVESRLIQQIPDAPHWLVTNGPFTEDDLTSLPDTHWTLLIQEINKHIIEFAQLQDRFCFLPNWRLDDVMVSFAPEGGTVGPHADNYDVFIIQGTGERRWQINCQEPGYDDLIPDLPLRIMKEMVVEQEWILQPGDMLYLPPGVAHHGVALNDSISISVGFRAPTVGDLLSGFYGDAIAARPTSSFISDPDLAYQQNCGEISLSSRHQIRDVIRALATDDASIDRWFGSYITDIRPGHYLPEPDTAMTPAQLQQQLQTYPEIWRSEYARYAYIENDQGMTLFVAGEEFPLDKGLTTLGKLLCSQRHFTATELQPWLESGINLLAELYNLGALYFSDE